MNQNWLQFGTNSAQPSEAEVSSKEHRKRLLTGAVAEYLDEEKVEEFICDLFQILVRESEVYLSRASAFSSCAKLIERGLSAMAEEEAGEEG